MFSFLTIALIVFNVLLLAAIFYYPKKIKENICRDINLDLVLEKNPQARSIEGRLSLLERKDQSNKLQQRMLNNRLVILEQKLEELSSRLFPLEDEQKIEKEVVLARK